MAIDIDNVTEASGKATLVSNTTFSILFEGRRRYLEIINGISSILYYKIEYGGTDETAVTPASIETRAVGAGLTGIVELGGSGGGFVLNLECAVAGDVVAQLNDFV